MDLSYEQPTSAHGALTRAGIKHGDTQRVELVVGTMPSNGGSHVAFCPAEVRAGKRLKKGPRRERHLPITGDIEFVNPHLVAERLAGQTGFAYMSAIAHTNGHVTLTVDLDSIQVFHPEDADPTDLRSSYGHPFSRHILETVKA